MREVLFICSGNYYRSRFAEAVFNHAAEAGGLDWRAFSRGLATHLVIGAGDLSIYTRFALAARSIPLKHTGQRPAPLTTGDLERAACVVALKEDEHRALMRIQFPTWEERIRYWHVHDLDVAAPDVAVPAIEQLTLALVQELSRSTPADARRPDSP